MICDQALDTAITTLLKGELGENSSRPDPSSLSEALAEIDAMVAALRDLRIHIDRRLTTLARTRNSHPPINKLPVELTTSLLMDTIPDYTFDLRPLQAFASVQVRWWNVIRSNACFWTSLHVSSSPEVASLKIHKSGDLPLSIGCGDCATREDLEGFLQLVAPQRHRWREFSFRGSDVTIIKTYVESPLLNLQELRLSSSSYQEYLDVTGAPDLRHVKLGSIIIPFTHGILSNLRTLTIRDVSDLNLTPSVLREILRSSLDLHSLSLEYVYERGGAAEEDTIEPVPLSHVSDVRLWNVSTPLSLYLLRVLRPNHRFDFSSQDELGASALFSALVHPREDGSSPVSSILAQESIPSFEISLGNDYFGLRGSSAEPDCYLRISLTGQNIHSILQDNARLLPLTQPIDLYCEIDALNEESDVTHVGVPPLPTTRFLQFSGGATWTLKAIEQLSKPVSGEWLLPHLTKIRFGWSWGAYIEEERWPSLMSALQGLVAAREKQPNAQPITIFDRVDVVVEDIANCPFTSAA